MEISKSEYEKMQRQIAKLEALERGGVDNWEFYGDSLAEWQKENEIDELLQSAIDEMNEILCDAEVDYPAGREAGTRITFDEDVAKRVFLKIFDEYHAIKVRK
ncbi:MAG: hypothetical protein [Bacteriophage sp.]|nr:MAG: hypothetical protein [Bacteriophage sp.]